MPGRNSDFLQLELPSEISGEFGLQAVHKLFRFLTDTYNGYPCNLWNKCKDYKPRIFLKQPGQQRYSKENDANADFTRSVDLLVLVSFLGMPDLCEHVPKVCFCFLKFHDSGIVSNLLTQEVPSPLARMEKSLARASNMTQMRWISLWSTSGVKLMRTKYGTSTTQSTFKCFRDWMVL